MSRRVCLQVLGLDDLLSRHRRGGKAKGSSLTGIIDHTKTSMDRLYSVSHADHVKVTP